MVTGAGKEIGGKKSPAASTDARPCTRSAILFRPSGPWYTAYMAEMLASRAYSTKGHSSAKPTCPAILAAATVLCRMELCTQLCRSKSQMFLVERGLPFESVKDVIAGTNPHDRGGGGPGLCRCWRWPCHGGCAALASALPCAAQAHRVHPC